MKKISNMFSKMKAKDWIVVALWMSTLIFLFSFVGVVSGLNKKSGEVSTKAHWTYKLTEKGNKDVKAGTKLVAMPKEIYGTKEEALKAETALTDDENKDKNKVWTFDSLKAGTPSNGAKKAQNAIAAVALAFFISLTAAIFGTAYIKYRERKAGK